MIWTLERETLLTELWNVRELSASECAAKLGVSRNAVIGKADRLGLAERRSPILPRLSRAEAKARRNELQRQRRASKAKTPRVRKPRVPKPPKAAPAHILEKPHGVAWEAIPGFAPVSLLDLGAGQCKWPVGQDGPYLFCGAPATHRHYCAHHHAWSIGNGTPSERSAIKAAKRADSIERFIPDREAA